MQQGLQYENQDLQSGRINQGEENHMLSDQELSPSKLENLSEKEREQLRVILGNIEKDFLSRQVSGQNYQPRNNKGNTQSNEQQQSEINERQLYHQGLMSSARSAQQFYSPQRSQLQYPRDYENWVIRQSLSPRRDLLSSKTIYRRNVLEELKGCTFEPEICSRSTKIAPREANMNPKDYLVNYLYGDALQRMKNQELRRISDLLKQSRQVNASKIDYKSQQIVLQRIQEQLQNLLNELDEIEQGRIGFEALGLYLEKLGILKQLQFKQDPNNQTSLYLSDRAKQDPQGLQREMAFHEFFWKLTNFPNQFTNNSDQNEVGNNKTGSSINQVQSITKEVVFDLTMILMEKKLEISKAVGMVKEVLAVHAEIDNELCDQNFGESEVAQLRNFIREFRSMMDDNSAIMSWYSTKKAHLLSEYQLDEKEGEQPQFHPKINKKSKNERGEYLLKKFNLSPEKQHHLSRVELLYQHKNYIDRKLQEKQQQDILELEKKCPFKPEINPPRELPEFNEADEFNNSAQKDRFTKLYYDHFAINQKLKDKKMQLEEQKSMMELVGCTFKPTITTKKIRFDSTINKTVQSSVEMIKGSQSMIDRYQKARENKILQESYWETKNQTWMHRDMSRTTQQQPFSFLGRESKSFRDRNREPQAVVEVNLTKNKKGKILVYPGDDPRILAQNFAKVYSLSEETKATLTEKLEQHLQEIKENNQ